MKVMHIITSLKIGGAESALYNLLSQLKENKDDQHYVAYFHDGPNVQKIQNLSIPVFKISGVLHTYDPLIYCRLKKLIKKINPDIIHSALWSANFISKLIAKKLKIPIVCDLHSNFSHDGKIRAFLETFTAHMATKYIAVSSTAYQGFADSVIKKIKDENKQKQIQKTMTIIQNGIDVTATKHKALENPLSKKELGFTEDDFVIGAVGRLEPIKSYDLLINAFKEIQKEKNIKLCLVGDGSERAKLEAMVLKLGLTDKVIFLGQRADAIRFYPLFDCFVISSISEGLSIAILEALCFGLPIISTHRGLQHDVIVDGHNGFLTPVGNKHILAEKIKALYKDKNLCHHIKINNQKLAEEKFDITHMKNAYQRAYSDLFKKKFDF